MTDTPANAKTNAPVSTNPAAAAPDMDQQPLGGTSTPRGVSSSESAPSSAKPPTSGAPASASDSATATGVNPGGPRHAQNQVIKEIYKLTLSECQPHVPNGPWSDYRDRCAVRGITQPEATLLKLQSAFSVENLERSRVVTKGAATLNPAIVGTDKILIPLYKEKLHASDSSGPFDVMTAGGCLSGRLAALAVVDDNLGGIPLPEGPSHVHIVPTLDDVVLLRALHFRAAPPTGLAEMKNGLMKNGPLTRFFQYFGTDNSWPGLLAFHPWSITTLASTDLPGLSDIREFFRKAETHLGLSLADAWVLRMDAKANEAIAFARDAGGFSSTMAVVRRVISEKLSEDLVTQKKRGQASDAPASLSPSDAAAKLGPLPRGGVTRQTRMKASRDFNEALEQELLQPLRQRAMAERDAIQKNLSHSLVETFGVSHRFIRDLAERLAVPPDSGSPFAAANPVTSKELSALARVNASTCLLTRELHKCQQFNQQEQRRHRRNKPPRPDSSPDSGSPTPKLPR